MRQIRFFFKINAIYRKRRRHCRWSVFAGVIIFGVCMYILPHFVLPRSSHYGGALTKWTMPMTNDTHLSDYSYSKLQPLTLTIDNTSKVLETNIPSISYAYDNNWVGFPDFKSVDCSKPLNYPTLNRQYPNKLKRTIPADFLTDTKNCASFITKYGFSRHPAVLQEELDFPIAFSMLFHRDLDQVNFLLRAIYRPHNVYCLTVDTKTSVEFLEATRSIARCLPNVFVSSKLENVVYAGFSRLMADLNCFGDLLKHPVQWKYVINSPGQAFPLRTNLELVRILKMFNGTNDIEARTGIFRKEDRYLTKYEYLTNRTSGEVTLNKTSVKHSPPPHGLEIVKCSAYGCFTRQFIQFILTSQIAKDLLEWTKPVYSPDELYWATLNYNTIVPAPGGFKGVPRATPWVTSFSIWEEEQRSACVTKFVRGVCILTPGDLPMITKQPCLFVNKFHVDHHPVALHCMDQFIYNLTFSRAMRDSEYFEGLDLPRRGGLNVIA